MMTSEDVIAYLERVIAEDYQSRNRAGLRNSQTAAGVLMTVANNSGDKATAYRFRVLAAQAANKNEELGEKD
jgi:hypothetical protein